MWGDIEEVIANTLVGEDVTGWLIQDSDSRYHQAIGRPGEHDTGCGGPREFVVFSTLHDVPFLRGSGTLIRVIKPATPPEPQIREVEVVKEVVREMTPEEVMRRAISIAEKMYHPRSSTFPWSHEKNAWLVAHSAICAAIEFSKEKSPS